jgi:hypothetical protein
MDADGHAAVELSFLIHSKMAQNRKSLKSFLFRLLGTDSAFRLILIAATALTPDSNNQGRV